MQLAALEITKLMDLTAVLH